jgi:hypothetical protein
VILYHRTYRDRARSILEGGFRDGSGTYLTQDTFSGVWLSDEPLDINEGAPGDILLEVCTDLSESELLAYEWIEEGQGFREFLVPASIVNSRSRIRIAEDDGDLEGAE